MQLDELVEDQFDVVDRLRTIGMPGDADRFPGIEAVVDLAGLPLHFQTQLADRLLQLVRRLRLAIEPLELGFELEDRFLEREWIQCGHANRLAATPC